MRGYTGVDIEDRGYRYKSGRSGSRDGAHDAGGNSGGEHRAAISSVPICVCVGVQLHTATASH